MILALLVYLAANQGILVAQPIVINALAVGAVAETTIAYKQGENSSKVTNEELR